MNSPPPPPAPAMVPLLERGMAALEAHARKRPFPDALARDLYIGTMRAMHVVTHADFVTHAELVLRHVVQSGVATHILWKNGPIVALIQRRTR